MKRLSPLAAFVFSLWLMNSIAGCSSAEKASSQTPPESAAVTQQGERGVVIDIPAPATPEGYMKIVSVGITDLRQRDHEEKTPALHLRMSVRNEKGTEPWLVDSRAQLISFINGRQHRPAFVRAQGEKLPFIHVTPGETQDIELYYVLPDGRAHITELSGFALIWQIQAGSNVVTQTTSFDRVGRDDQEFSTFPVVPPREKGPMRAPASNAEPRKEPPIGVESDWWMDPFADLPFPWSEQSPQGF